MTAGTPLWHKFVWPLPAALLGILGAWYWIGGAGSAEALRVYGRVPPFALTDQGAAPFSSEALSGKPWVAGFIFTRCTTVCPRMSSRMARLQETLAPDAALLSISVDPEHDTPEVLASYARLCGARPGRWYFLTGTKTDIYRLAREGFFLPAAEAGEEGFEDPAIRESGDLFLHSSRLALVDGQGQIRGYYDSEDGAEMERLVRDAALLSGAARPAWLRRLPALNAMLNGASAILLVAGFLCIRRRLVPAHRACMLSAFTFSILFLASYLVYHYHAGSVRFTGQGWLRPLYFGILISHTILAALVPFLALAALWQAFRERFDKHRRVARWALPLWLYVSVTGVLIYWMLYHLCPPAL